MTANVKGVLMTDPNQRRMNWQIKTDTGKVKAILDDLRPDMLKRFEAAVASLCEMEVKARQTLNAAGVHTIFYVSYLNYARQLYKLSRQQGISGEIFERTGTAFRRGKPCLYPVGSCFPGPARQMVEPRPRLRRPRQNPHRSLRRLYPDAVGLPMPGISGTLYLTPHPSNLRTTCMC